MKFHVALKMDQQKKYETGINYKTMLSGPKMKWNTEWCHAVCIFFKNILYKLGMPTYLAKNIYKNNAHKSYSPIVRCLSLQRKG